MLVRKQIKIDDVCLKMDAATGTFEGYAARFGGTDTYGDTLIKGAFASTLRQNGKPKMFYGHDWSMPIGRFDKVMEDESGLLVKGQLTPNHSVAADVRAGLIHGTMDGLSIGGFVAKGDAEDKADGNGQIINKFTKLVDISVVPFPADSGARIDMASVKNSDLREAIDEIETIRDFERLLRDAGSFSRAEATALVSRAKAVFMTGDPVTKKAEAEVGAFVERAKRFGELRI